MGISIRPVCEAVGCFVDGIKVSDASDQEISACRELLFQHGVIFFRDQDLSPEAQKMFAERMGKIEINRFFTPVPGHPEIAQVITEPDQEWVVGENWHTDHSYDSAPALGSILYAVEVPPVGGNTCFAGMQAAYDALPQRTKDRIDNLQARHESAHIFAPSEEKRLSIAEDREDNAYIERAASYPEAVHPIALAHPVTGRKGLYVNPEFTTSIIGLEREESEDLLSSLYEHILEPRFVYQFEWAPGSIAVWDNRSTWHRAMNDYHGHRRHMRRITLEGVPLN